jgi:hypothetical protein
MAALICILRGLPKDDSGIIQILREHTSEVWKQPKKIVRTQLQGCLKIWGLTTGIIPSRIYFIDTVIPNMYEETKAEVKENLKLASTHPLQLIDG